MLLNSGVEELLRVPWTARRSNQSIRKEISPGCSLEGLMPKLKLQYFNHLMQRVDSLEKTLMLGGIGGRRKWGRQRMRWLDGISDSMDVEFEWTPGDGDEQGGLAYCDSWGCKESDTTERLKWTNGHLGVSFENIQTKVRKCNFGDLLLWRYWCIIELDLSLLNWKWFKKCNYSKITYLNKLFSFSLLTPCARISQISEYFWYLR